MSQFEGQVTDALEAISTTLADVVDQQNKLAQSLDRLNSNLGRLVETVDFRMTTMEEIAVRNREDAAQARANTHDIRSMMTAVVEAINELARSVHRMVESARGASSARSDRLQAVVARVNSAADKTHEQ